MPLVYKSIWVEEWSAASPTHQAGWSSFFEASKHVATEEVKILEGPSLEKDEPPRLAAWLKPIRRGMSNGDGAHDYAGKMLRVDGIQHPFSDWWPSGSRHSSRRR